MKLLEKVRNKLSVVKTVVAQAEPSNGRALGIALDFLYCKLRFQVSSEEYLKYRYYQYQNRYRKNFLLVHHQHHDYRYISPVGLAKYKFYTTISDCYSREIIRGSVSGEEGFLEFVRKHKKVISKPDGGTYGRGIDIFTYENDEQALAYFRQKPGETVYEELIRQHDALAALNPHCVNSIRILALRKKGSVEILSATLKTSSTEGTFVDNMHSGGIGAMVDLETGIVYTFGYDYEGNKYTHHPITGTQFIGLNIPHWEDAVALVKKAHARMRGSGILGWDIAITPTGADIIEANNRPGPLLTQVMDGIPKGEKVLLSIKQAKRKKKKKKR